MPHIFFYGTLMRGFDLRRRTAIDPLLRLVGQGVVRGALYDLGPYPAAVRAEGTIRGEVYAVTDPVRLLPLVDAVERYLPDDPARSEYVRAAAPVALDGAGRCTAWIYFYAQPLVGAVRIPSGDYREYLARVGSAGCAATADPRALVRGRVATTLLLSTGLAGGGRRAGGGADGDGRRGRMRLDGVWNRPGVRPVGPPDHRARGG